MSHGETWTASWRALAYPRYTERASENLDVAPLKLTDVAPLKRYPIWMNRNLMIRPNTDGTPSTASLYRGGASAHETYISRGLAAVADIAEYVRRGDMALARQARETLDTLCLESGIDGLSYPPAIREALRAAGLRDNARAGQ